MIVCDFSKVEPMHGECRITLSEKIVGALGLFRGQRLFGFFEEGSRRLILSPMRLNPSVSLFRIYLEDIRGSLAQITEIIKRRNVNILNSGAFTFGNIWVSEFILDLKGLDATPDEIRQEIEELGAFVTSNEITEYFPRAFDLQSKFEIIRDEKGKGQITIPSEDLTRAGFSTNPPAYAVLSAWTSVRALFVDFYSPEAKLVRVSARIRDVPGALHSLASLLRTQIDLQAIDEQHQDEASGEWTGFGILIAGRVSQLAEKAMNVASILHFDSEPLGWKE